MASLPFIAGNWKMNLGVAQSVELAKAISKEAPFWRGKAEVGICPSTLCFDAVRKAITADNCIVLGAQNLHWSPASAQTGESSLEQLQEVGGSFTLVGHSERRSGLGETLQIVNDRCIGILKRNFRVLLCIGETLAERESGQTLRILQEQLAAVLSTCPPEAQDLLDIAYEPVWAIGTGKVASLAEIADAHAFIAKLFSEARWERLPRILYGGSVKPDNFESIIKIQHVDGALVGGASLAAESFLKLVEIACS
jgi:triosephosphate isomerase